MDYLERLQALVYGLFFEGAGKVIVAFTAAKGHVSFAMACEDGDDVCDASIAWRLSRPQRDANGQWLVPSDETAILPVRLAVADAIGGYLNRKAPGWAAGAGSHGTVTLEVPKGTVGLDLTRHRPRRRRRRRKRRGRHTRMTRH